MRLLASPATVRFGVMGNHPVIETHRVAEFSRGGATEVLEQKRKTASNWVELNGAAFVSLEPAHGLHLADELGVPETVVCMTQSLFLDSRLVSNLKYTFIHMHLYMMPCFRWAGCCRVKVPSLTRDYSQQYRRFYL